MAWKHGIWCAKSSLLVPVHYTLYFSLTICYPYQLFTTEELVLFYLHIIRLYEWLDNTHQHYSTLICSIVLVFDTTPFVTKFCKITKFCYWFITCYTYSLHHNLNILILTFHHQINYFKIYNAFITLKLCTW